MNKILENIFEQKEYLTTQNKLIKIHSETNKGQCQFLQKIISENNFKKSIEIGFAFGLSTLSITEAVVENNGKHVVIDKFEFEHWEGVGLDLIIKAGLNEHLEFHEEFCYKVLPVLLQEKRTFDFAYIDSTKQFDWLLIDFFYLDKMLDIGGVIVFDDVPFPGIRKLIRLISQFPNFEIYETFPANYKPSFKRRIANLFRFVPFSKYFLKESILYSDYEMGINTSCVALRKIDDDKRNWDWHKEF